MIDQDKPARSAGMGGDRSRESGKKERERASEEGGRLGVEEF